MSATKESFKEKKDRFFKIKYQFSENFSLVNYNT